MGGILQAIAAGPRPVEVPSVQDIQAKNMQLQALAQQAQLRQQQRDPEPNYAGCCQQPDEQTVAIGLHDPPGQDRDHDITDRAPDADGATEWYAFGLILTDSPKASVNLIRLSDPNQLAM